MTAPALAQSFAAARLRPVGRWGAIVPLTILVLVFVAARAHELVPVLPKLRPALVLMALGSIGFFRTAPAVLRRVLSDRLTQFTLGYLVWAVIGVPFALYRGLAFTSLMALLTVVYLVGVVLICPPTLRVLDRLQWALVTGSLGTAVASLAYNRGSHGRLSQGGSLDSNDLAALVALSIPLALGLALRLRGRLLLRLYYLAATGVFGYTLVRTGSRGGIVAIAVAVAVLLAGLRGARRWVGIVLVAVSATTLWQVGGEDFRTRINAFVSGEQDYNYTAYGGRKQIWQRARGYVASSPIFGVGMGNFRIAEGDSCQINFPGRGCKWSAPHNAYLQAAAELGIPGGMLFVGIIAMGAKRALRFWRAPPGDPVEWRRPELLASLLGFAASATFLSHAYFPMLFALVALIGLANLARDDADALVEASARLPRTSAEPPPPIRRRGVRGGLAYS